MAGAFEPKAFPSPPPLRCRGRTLDFERVRIMGTLNLTPDSFSDGGLLLEPAAALEAAARMAEEGADILDLGGESTRPGSDPVSVEEELRRVLPVLERLDPEAGPLLSVDTRRPEVARAALERGVHIVNDVTGLRDPAMREVVANFGAAAIIMHMQGEPKTMQLSPHYEDVVGDIRRFFEERLELAARDGVREVMLDPGVGFGKTFDHNLELLRRLAEFLPLGRPLVVGVSRKSFIGAATGVERPAERLEGTIVCNAAAVWGGAHVLRVHDVREAVRTARMARALALGMEA
ncbi:MAG: dihydropteroate synthase [Nitrospinota bacterium]